MFRASRCASSLYVVGLTGGIASGKTSRCQRIQALGEEAAGTGYAFEGRALAHVSYLSADQLGHLSYAPGTNCYSRVVEAFGKEILEADENGGSSLPKSLPPAIDRRKLGPIVFSNPAKMNLLNSLVWPALKELVKERIDEEGKLAEKAEAAAVEGERTTTTANPSTLKSGSLLILEAALLLEIGLIDFCDEVWLITVDKAEAVKRLTARDQCTEEMALKKLSSQMDPQERVSLVEELALHRKETGSKCTSEDSGKCSRVPLQVEVLDTTGMDLEEDLRLRIPQRFDALLQRVLSQH